uniref:Uncharacterized protein n=1 Tax=Oryza sativa subsp. japonica TaxID=39947 RepID=Q69PE9_ORYSJ|nr:hypothetical protein [Oryza sativa Japonica Group]
MECSSTLRRNASSFPAKNSSGHTGPDATTFAVVLLSRVYDFDEIRTQHHLQTLLKAEKRSNDMESLVIQLTLLL